MSYGRLKFSLRMAGVLSREIPALLMLVGTALASSQAHADTAVSAKISLLHHYQTHSGFLVRLATTMPDPDGCGRTDWYILPDTTPRVALVQSMLLTAESSDRTVSITIGGCYEGMPKILHLTM